VNGPCGGAAELARREVAYCYGVQLSPPLLLPSPAIGTFGAASSSMSAVPNRLACFDMAAAASCFDMAAAASIGALMASFALITGGLLMPLEPENCAWVNPGIFPFVLKRLISMQAGSYVNACAELPNSGGLVAAPAALVAGCLSAMTAAFNILPLGRLDGGDLVLALPWPGVRNTALPWMVFTVLGCTFVGVDSDLLFPVILAFCVFTLGIRLQKTLKKILPWATVPAASFHQACVEGQRQSNT